MENQIKLPLETTVCDDEGCPHHTSKHVCNTFVQVPSDQYARLQRNQRDRQPTDAMLDEARDWSYKKYGKPIGDDAAIGCWQAMWDAADANQ